ncbi:hypothetical protein CLOSTASPAR_05244 [[Clostridium] asparagiforme DSM 15981]|uniref:Uncharacterized protein n=1 Tax=[Clostridium] asparagiforme DSM 15981 TaxID=518636 RepID=C0D7J7_9FIRM|nr:hypothetical protein CLOSTASPAR_05244 [[Clostridium] asparagiforme DSM 15981]
MGDHVPLVFYALYTAAAQSGPSHPPRKNGSIIYKKVQSHATNRPKRVVYR